MQTIRFLTQTIGDDYIHFLCFIVRETRYWAKEIVGFTKKLAYARAAVLGLEPSSEICCWYGMISCCIQRANAKILRGEPVPGRHATPVPGGCFRSAEGIRKSKQHLRRCRGYLVCGRILRPLQLRVSSGAMHLLAVSFLLELLGCLQYLSLIHI